MSKTTLTPDNSFFKRDSIVTMTGADFALLNQAVDEAIAMCTKRFRKHVNKFIDTKTGEPVELDQVTKEKVDSGEIRVVMDVYKSMNPEQEFLGYTPDLSPAIMEAKRTLYTTLHRACINGETFSHAEIDAEEEKLLEKVKLEQEKATKTDESN